jgi:hypothetical protein
MHFKLIIPAFMLSLLLPLVIGCGSSSTDSQNSSQSVSQAPVDNTAASTQTQKKFSPPPPPPPQTSSNTNKQTPVVTPPANTGPQSPTPGPGMVIEKADVGSGDKGRGYEEGIITTPVATYFAARERIMFTIQIPELIKAYKLEHDFKGPKSHDEFMKAIIEKYNVKLPTLPPGHNYLYDPKTEVLMVERPKEF